MLVHGVDEAFLGIIKAGHNGDVQDTAKSLRAVGVLEMAASLLSTRG